MGNPSNGPAAVTWLNMFAMMDIRAVGVNWSHLVTGVNAPGHIAHNGVSLSFIYLRGGIAASKTRENQ